MMAYTLDGDKHCYLSTGEVKADGSTQGQPGLHKILCPNKHKQTYNSLETILITQKVKSVLSKRLIFLETS